MKDMSQASWKAVAKSAFKNASSWTQFMQIHRINICPLERIAHEVPSHSQVLDVGCGAGLFLLALCASGRCSDGLGVDISSTAIREALRAKETASELLPQDICLNFQAHPPEELFPEESFKVVCALDVMHHVAPCEQYSFFKNLAQATAPGGLLIYKDMAKRPRPMAWMNQLHDLVVARQWIHCVPLEQIKSWAEECELEVLSETSHLRFWYAHQWIVFKKR